MAGFPTDDPEEEVDHELGRNFNGSVDELGEVHVQTKSNDVHADAVVRQGHAVPAEQPGILQKKKMGNIVLYIIYPSIKTYHTIPITRVLFRSSGVLIKSR